MRGFNSLLACHSHFVQEFIHNARFRSLLGFGNQFNAPDDLRVELVYLRQGIEARSARSIAPTSIALVSVSFPSLDLAQQSLVNLYRVIRHANKAMFSVDPL